MNTKTCTRCGHTKPVTDFTRRKASTDGHVARCKQCVTAANRELAEQRKQDSERQCKHVRLRAKWEPWEVRFLTENPHLEPREAATKLQRTTASIKAQRFRMKRDAAARNAA